MMPKLIAEPVRIPVSGDVLLAWDEPAVDADGTVLQGHSLAILERAVDN